MMSDQHHHHQTRLETNQIRSIADFLPLLLLKNVIGFMNDNIDRVSLSLVCKKWFQNRDKYLYFKQSTRMNKILESPKQSKLNQLDLKSYQNQINRLLESTLSSDPQDYQYDDDIIDDIDDDDENQNNTNNSIINNNNNNQISNPYVYNDEYDYDDDQLISVEGHNGAGTQTFTNHDAVSDGNDRDRKRDKPDPKVDTRALYSQYKALLVNSATNMTVQHVDSQLIQLDELRAMKSLPRNCEYLEVNKLGNVVTMNEKAYANSSLKVYILKNCTIMEVFKTSKLPKCLEELYLSSNMRLKFDILLPNLRVADLPEFEEIAVLSQLKHLESLTLRKVGLNKKSLMENRISIDDIFPLSLITLKLIHCDGMENITKLPANLRHLRLTGDFTGIQTSILPASLQTLKMRGSSIKWPSEHNPLPSSLCHLTYEYGFDLVITNGSLFANVTTLDLGIIYDQELPKLPSSIKSLTLHLSIGSPNSVTNYNNLSVIGSDLKELKLHYYQNYGHMLLTAGKLPDKIKRLSMLGYFSQNLKREVLPTSLKSLVLGQSFILKLTPASLPLSLESIEFHTKGKIHAKIESGAFQPSLRKLSVDLTFFTSNPFESLPTSIKAIEMSIEQRNYQLRRLSDRSFLFMSKYDKQSHYKPIAGIVNKYYINNLLSSVGRKRIEDILSQIES